jgi:hypothetical protein
MLQDTKRKKIIILPFWSEETNNWLKPHESIQRQSYSLVMVTEGVLKVHQRENCAACSKKDSRNLQRN